MFSRTGKQSAILGAVGGEQKAGWLETSIAPFPCLKMKGTLFLSTAREGLKEFLKLKM